MREEFRKWWVDGGSEAWAAGLDAKGGTLEDLEMVFNAGVKSSKDVVYKLHDEIKLIIDVGYTGFIAPEDLDRIDKAADEARKKIDA